MMGEQNIRVISLAAGFIVLIIAYIRIFLNGKSGKQKFVEKAKKKGNYTSAKIVGSKRRIGRASSNNMYTKNDSYLVEYEYFVKGIRFSKKVRFHTCGNMSADYPYETTVYYNPGNPRKSVLREEALPGSFRQTGCFITIALAGITISVVYNLLKLL